jgi:hypothetical protein
VRRDGLRVNHQVTLVVVERHLRGLMTHFARGALRRATSVQFFLRARPPSS